MKLELSERISQINVFDEKRPLGDRMKEYENLTRFTLDGQYPMIIRLDGNAFHTFTRGFEKPFDRSLMEALQMTAKYLVENIPGAQCAYHQSDEISILITNYKLSNTEPWFDNNINKIVSLTASMATLQFNRIFSEIVRNQNQGELRFKEVGFDPYFSKLRSIENGALFDSRVFILPKDEVINYFIWRQQDAIKNAVSMAAQSMFSHKTLQNLNSLQMIDRMKNELSIDYEQRYSIVERRGSIIHRLAPAEFEKTIKQKNGIEKTIKYERSEWGVDLQIPVFRDNREYIEKFI